MVATNYRVVFAPEARDDLRCLYLYIAERGGPERAMAYIARLEAYCAGFAVFPERGGRATTSFQACVSSGLSVGCPWRFGLAPAMWYFCEFFTAGATSHPPSIRLVDRGMIVTDTFRLADKKT